MDDASETVHALCVAIARAPTGRLGQTNEERERLVDRLVRAVLRHPSDPGDDDLPTAVLLINAVTARLDDLERRIDRLEALLGARS